MNTNKNSVPTPEAIHFAHRRAFRMTAGATTFKQHCMTCTSCASVEANKKK